MAEVPSKKNVKKHKQPSAFVPSERPKPKEVTIKDLLGSPVGDRYKTPPKDGAPSPAVDECWKLKDITLQDIVEHVVGGDRYKTPTKEEPSVVPSPLKTPKVKEQIITDILGPPVGDRYKTPPKSKIASNVAVPSAIESPKEKDITTIKGRLGPAVGDPYQTPPRDEPSPIGVERPKLQDITIEDIVEHVVGGDRYKTPPKDLSSEKVEHPKSKEKTVKHLLGSPIGDRYKTPPKDEPSDMPLKSKRPKSKEKTVKDLLGPPIGDRYKTPPKNEPSAMPSKVERPKSKENTVKNLLGPAIGDPYATPPKVSKKTSPPIPVGSDELEDEPSGDDDHNVAMLHVTSSDENPIAAAVAFSTANKPIQPHVTTKQKTSPLVVADVVSPKKVAEVKQKTSPAAQPTKYSAISSSPPLPAALATTGAKIQAKTPPLPFRENTQYKDQKEEEKEPPQPVTPNERPLQSPVYVKIATPPPISPGRVLPRAEIEKMLVIPYLKYAVGEILQHALEELLRRRPKEPVQFVANFLLNTPEHSD